MAKPGDRLFSPDGRRLAAPPRRVPAPANDNRTPAAVRIKQVAFLAVLAAMAAAMVVLRYTEPE